MIPEAVWRKSLTEECLDSRVFRQWREMKRGVVDFHARKTITEKVTCPLSVPRSGGTTPGYLHESSGAPCKSDHTFNAPAGCLKDPVNQRRAVLAKKSTKDHNPVGVPDDVDGEMFS